MRAETDDRFVLVSNYTSMLDIFATMAREFGWSYVRLDGSTTQKKRTALVAQFNEKRPKGDDIFLFLLSSKAGGCGLNLIGGNRLVLFDPDWNPANDKQAAARVWRDGQTKRVYIYRMVVAGSIEEFVYERQLSKEGLAGVASNEQVLTSALSTSELKDLFTYHDKCGSHFHQKLKVRPARSRRAAAIAASCLARRTALARAGALDAQRTGSHPFPQRRHHHACAPLCAPLAASLPASVLPALFSPPPRPPKCARCAAMLEERAGERDGLFVPQLGNPKETDGLETWAHHHGCSTVDDEMMAEAGQDLVSFVFSLHVSGRDVGELAAIAQQREDEARAKAAAAAAAEAAAAAGKENAARLNASRYPGAGGSRPPLPLGPNRRLSALAAGAQLQPRPARPVRAKRARVERAAGSDVEELDSDDDDDEMPESSGDEEESAALSPSEDDEDD